MDFHPRTAWCRASLREHRRWPRTTFESPTPSPTCGNERWLGPFRDLVAARERATGRG